MIHTAAPSVLTTVLCIGFGVASRAQDKPSSATQSAEIKKVIADLQQREKALKAVTLEMQTTGSYSGGIQFKTTGWLRVLGTTHFHIHVDSAFQDVSSAVTTVITPEGMWTHQSGPLGEVYTHMKKDLMERLKTAERRLAADSNSAIRNPGPFAGSGEALLGSATIEALDLQYELAFVPQTEKVDDVECRVIRGSWRGSKALPADETSRAVHRVEVFVRKADGIPIRVVHYNRRDPNGKVKESNVFEMKISNLDLAPKLTAESFRLDIPDGAKLLPVRDHRPSRAQIDRILQEYAALLEDQKDKENEKDKSGAASKKK